jgi:uncharacterized protein YyaL (SSP411 family)
LQRAHAASGNLGISKGYDLLRGAWSPAYPETTGYTIPTLLNAAGFLQDPDLQSLALTLADQLIALATPEGGVVHWQSQREARPIVFDTGQVIFGWLAACKFSQQERYLRAACRAADWLVAIQEPTGSWKQFQYLEVEKVIDTRVAWALAELYQLTGKNDYYHSAVRNCEWALNQQDALGWYSDCSFRKEEDPFTHTLAYTAEGLLECGRLFDESRFISSARLMADALYSRQRPDGRLSSTYGPGWHATSASTCLTGNCQMGILWLRLFELTGAEEYREAARKAISYVAAIQRLAGDNANIRGGIPGSDPIYGVYERFKYPNWAVKFFVDALLIWERVQNGIGSRDFVG